MKEIFREYGRALLTTGVVVLILFLVFSKLSLRGNTGLLSVLGQDTIIRGKDFVEYQDSKSSHTILSKHSPEITYIGSSVKAGENIILGELFEAKDWEGKEVKIEVREIMDKEMKILLKEDEIKEFTFPKSGIYGIVLRARDSQGGTARSTIWVPVNPSGGRRI